MVNFPRIDMKATGARITELRKAKGLKVKDISDYMGFTETQAVYKWQRGESLPSVDNLLALSVLFGTSMNNIIVSDMVADDVVILGEFHQNCA